MPATIVTKEPFDADVSKQALDAEIKLRIKAGAIRAWIQDGSKWVLCTEWNVVGEQ